MLDVRKLSLTPARKAVCRRIAHQVVVALVASAIAGTIINAPVIAWAVRYLATAFVDRP